MKNRKTEKSQPCSQMTADDPKKLSLIALLITSAGILALPWTLALPSENVAVSNSLLMLLLFLLALPVVKHALCRDHICKAYRPGIEASQLSKGAASDRFQIGVCAVFAFLLSAALIVGGRLEQEGALPFGRLSFWAALMALIPFCTVMLGKVWFELDRRRILLSSGSSRAAEEPHGGERRFLLVALALFACWFLILLAVYPGFFVYDAQDEFIQVQTRQFSTHHPLTHVLLLGGLISLVHKLGGSYNLGIAAYMIVQMLLCAACFSYVLFFLHSRKLPKQFLTGSFLFFAFFPVIQMYVLCSAKDTLYTAAMLTTTILLVQLTENSREFLYSHKMKGLSLSLLFMALMRHNGFYILLILVPVLPCLPGVRQESHGKRKMLAVTLFAVILYLCINAGLTNVLHAEKSENQELLTVPIQQLARVYTYEPDVFSEEERMCLYEILPEEALRRYKPQISDGVKYSFNNEAYNADPSRYQRLWLDIGLRKPAVYLNAWLMTSYGYWYPDAVIDVYRGNTVFTFTYEDSSYFGFETEQPGERSSKIPWLNEWFRKLSLEIYQQRVPVVSMLFSPGFWFWFYALGTGYLISRKHLQTLPALFPILLNWLTVLLGPTYLVRYVLIFWFAAPVMVYLVLYSHRNFN